MFAFVVLDFPFSTKPRNLLGRTPTLTITITYFGSVGTYNINSSINLYFLSQSLSLAQFKITFLVFTGLV